METMLDLHGAGAANELYICRFGEEKCAPAHAFGPSRRDHYLIHFVASGCGTLYCGGDVWHVRAGQGFLILPEEETYYQADEAAPWHYAWVGYCGTQAEALTGSAGLSAQRRVFDAPDKEAAWQALCSMRREARGLWLNQLAAVGNLLRFIALIAPAQGPEEAAGRSRAYCERALWYMESCYERDVSIGDTAAFVGLSRSHLYRVMKEVCGCSPKEALLQIRMRRAKQLLQSTELTLEEIAKRVGMQTGAQLGTAFRRVCGMTPGQYRKGR